jgi:hypothetical protein
MTASAKLQSAKNVLWMIMDCVPNTRRIQSATSVPDAKKVVETYCIAKLVPNMCPYAAFWIASSRCS